MLLKHNYTAGRNMMHNHPNQQDKEQDRTCWHNQNRTKSIIKSSITNLCTTQHHSECYNRFTFDRRVYNCQWNITKQQTCLMQFGGKMIPIICVKISTSFRDSNLVKISKFSINVILLHHNLLFILVRNQTIINGRRKDIQASLKNEEFSRKIKENYITKK